MDTIAVLGTGRVGTAVARIALDAGYAVHVAASGAASEIELLAEIMTPGARAMTAADAAREADIVVLAVPLHKYRNVDPAPLAGKIVIDALNYWAPVDGVIDEFEGRGLSTSEIVAEHFTHSRMVKTLNHIGYHEMEEDRLPSGMPGRRALAVASDDSEAAEQVRGMLDRFGFDALHSGPLVTGRAFEAGTPIFNGSFTAEELRKELSTSVAALAR
ncbi:NAD(P)-binding domain-containing protein [Aeromicrobium sp. PE09-221]|uniref:NADPH-dependent F420 reductase n=1 Tax=Aeromicrobium sp. PE09-221 TaxID=1898043 RepID=UPI00191C905A|nr:NAD(P)-binding domain-containing protein [Aeromicrobium sp. PE09-221]